MSHTLQFLSFTVWNKLFYIFNNANLPLRAFLSLIGSTELCALDDHIMHWKPPRVKQLEKSEALAPQWYIVFIVYLTTSYTYDE